MENPFNILVATDYHGSAAAEHYAIQLAKVTRSAVRFTHVFRPELFGTTISFDTNKVEYAPLRHEYDKLYNHVSGILKTMSISPEELNFQCVIREGNSIRGQLLQEAEESETDLIITGTHDTKSFSEWILDNHTWDIIKAADVPVLAIPENVVFAGVKKILFATEYREGEMPAIRFLCSLAREFNAEVTILHISDNVLSDKIETELFEMFMEEVQSQVAYDKLDIRLIYCDDLIEGLNRYCEKQEMDWLVMSHERLTWLDKLVNPVERSMTRRMSFHTHTPLFILPDFYRKIYGERKRDK